MTFILSSQATLKPFVCCHEMLYKNMQIDIITTIYCKDETNGLAKLSALNARKWGENSGMGFR